MIDSLIIHPGETLEEVLVDRAISQQELAKMTGIPEAYISEVIRGVRPLTNSFARALESAFSIDASFWDNLQVNYEKELTM